MEFTIKRANKENVEGIRAIEQLSFSIPWTEQQILSQLPDNLHEMLVAVDENEKVLGYIGYMFVIDEGYMSNIAVIPEARHNGIAYKLIAAAVESAIKNELAFLTLEVRESNDAAINLYNKCNFKKVGVRKNYYKKPTEDAILMTLFF